MRESTKKRDKSTSEISIKNSKLFNEKNWTWERETSSRSGTSVLHMLTNMALLHSPETLGNMATENFEKYVLRTGENIDINRRESPFKVIMNQSILSDVITAILFKAVA